MILHGMRRERSKLYEYKGKTINPINSNYYKCKLLHYITHNK